MFLRVLFVCVLFFGSLSARDLTANEKNWKNFSDVFQFMPLFAGAYSLVKEDYDGALELVYGTLSTSLTTLSVKAIMDGSEVHISRRPDDGEYDGMPSGHTSSSFVGATYLAIRYWDQNPTLGVVALGLATLTGYARVKSRRHTTEQVIAGSLVGIGFGYLFTSKLEEKIGVNISVDMGGDKSSNTYYMLRLSKRF